MPPQSDGKPVKLTLKPKPVPVKKLITLTLKPKPVPVKKPIKITLKPKPESKPMSVKKQYVPPKKKDTDAPKKDIIFQRQKSLVYVIKTALKKVIRNQERLESLKSVVLECHELTTTVYQFMRLYLLKRYQRVIEQLENGTITAPPESLLPTFMKQGVPIVGMDEKLVDLFIMACTTRGGSGSRTNKVLLDELNQFYDEEFFPLTGKIRQSATHKTYLIDHLCTKIATAYDNNLKCHFLERIRHLMNVSNPIQDMPKNECAIIKNAILRDDMSKVPETHLSWALDLQQRFLPPVYEKCYGYDVLVNPDKYLYYTLELNRFYEHKNAEIASSNLSEEQKHIQWCKLTQPIPLCTSLVPCHMSFDVSFINEYFTPEKDKTYRQNHMSQYKDDLWNVLFDTNLKVMRPKPEYILKSVQTDGIAISLCFSHKSKKWGQKRIIPDEIPHWEDLSENDLAEIRKRDIVGGDPGKQSINFMMNDKKQKVRYTTAQRREESNMKRNVEILQQEKAKHQIQEKELLMVPYSCRTVDYTGFCNYIRARSTLCQDLKKFYSRELFRKMNLRKYYATRRSEDLFLNRVSETFGENIVISQGDWGRDSSMKYLVPSIGKGMRKILMRRFPLVLMGERGTSKYCNQCHQELQHYQGAYRLLHCPNCQNSSSDSNPTCFFNRDANACMNMLYLSHQWLDHRLRPAPYGSDIEIQSLGADQSPSPGLENQSTQSLPANV